MKFLGRKSVRLAALVVVVATGLGGGVVGAYADDPATGQEVQPYVVGGRDATEPYRWMASIQIPHPDTGEWRQTCGGSLIRPDVVVTARHCAVHFEVGSTQVRVGSYRWQDGGKLANVIQITNYPGDINAPGNDVAVLHLDREVSSKTIRIARDPGNVGDLDRVLGWGATCNYGSPEWPCYPAGLQEADVRIVNDNDCAGFDRSVELCVKGDQGQMACFGDSGGPLLREVNGRWQLIGATRGDGDADSGTNIDCSGGLGIWTDLTRYRDWIDRVADAPIHAPVDARPVVQRPVAEPTYTLPYEPPQSPQR